MVLKASCSFIEKSQSEFRQENKSRLLWRNVSSITGKNKRRLDSQKRIDIWVTLKMSLHLQRWAFTNEFKLQLFDNGFCLSSEKSILESHWSKCTEMWSKGCFSSKGILRSRSTQQRLEYKHCKFIGKDFTRICCKNKKRQNLILKLWCLLRSYTM